MEGIIAPTESERCIRAIPVSPGSVSAPTTVSKRQREAGVVPEIGIAVKQIPAIGGHSIGRAVKTVKISGVAVRTVVVPVVLIVDLFFYIPVFVVTAYQDIAIITVVGNNLIQVPVRALHDGQLGIAPGQTHGGNQHERQHRNPAGRPSWKAIRVGGRCRVGQHVGFPSLIDASAVLRTRSCQAMNRSESICVDASRDILFSGDLESGAPGMHVRLVVRPCSSDIGPEGNGSPSSGQPPRKAESKHRSPGSPSPGRPQSRHESSRLPGLLCSVKTGANTLPNCVLLL